jgi:hypothetical protein
VSTSRLTTIPAAIIAGDTVRVTLSIGSYAAPEWSLSWSLAGADTLSVESADNGSGHDLTLTAIETASLGAGLYQWRVRATDGSEVLTVQTGVLTVTADLSQLSGGDATPWEATALTVLQSSIAGSVEQNMAEFQIDGRRVTEIPLAERLKLLAWLESRIAARSGDAFGTPVRYSFQSATASGMTVSSATQWVRA